MQKENEPIHRGEWLKDKIKESGYSYKMIGDLIAMDKSTVFRMVTKEKLDISKMKLVADVLGIDLRVDFPESKIFYNENTLNYKKLYEMEKEKVQVLQEALEQYNVKPGQNRDNEE